MEEGQYITSYCISAIVLEGVPLPHIFLVSFSFMHIFQVYNMLPLRARQKS